MATQQLAVITGHAVSFSFTAISMKQKGTDVLTHHWFKPKVKYELQAFEKP